MGSDRGMRSAKTRVTSSAICANLTLKAQRVAKSATRPNAATFHPAPGGLLPVSLLLESPCSPCSTKFDCEPGSVFYSECTKFRFGQKLRVDVYGILWV